jgi:hypothetical protein
MKNSSVIFTDQWSTFPFHLFNGEKKPSQKPKPTSKVKFNSFYQTPDRVESKPMMKLLKENFGIEVDGVKTFKTDNISTIDHTSYNGLTFNLQLVENKVVLNVLTEGEFMTVSYWSIDTLLKSMNRKNIQKVNKTELIRLLINGELRVKFNVSKIKDHGTKWSFKSSKSIPVNNVVQPTLSKNEDDGFIDDFFSDF